MLRRAVRRVGHHDRRGARRPTACSWSTPERTAPHGAEIRDHVRADRARRTRCGGWSTPTSTSTTSSATRVFTDAHDPRAGRRRGADGRRRRAGPRADPWPIPSPIPDYPAITREVLQGVLDLADPAAGPDVPLGHHASTSAAGTSNWCIPGRGHTNGDLVVRVPDADVVYAGDLVEESAAPAFGSDCYPAGVGGAPSTSSSGMLTPASVRVARARRGGRPGVRDGAARGGLRRRRDDPVAVPAGRGARARRSTPVAASGPTRSSTCTRRRRPRLRSTCAEAGVVTGSAPAARASTSRDAAARLTAASTST